MAKLKYYVLCSSNMITTKRHLNVIPKEDIVYVFNSHWKCENNGERNAQYLKDAEAWCKAEDLEYYITMSDGTPATGKNSVFNLFQKSDNDYMVLVDGDDLITPHGLWVYNQIAQSESPPDAVALEYQLGIHPDPIFKPLITTTENPDHIIPAVYRTFLQDKAWWDSMLSGNPCPIEESDPEFSQRLNDAMARVYSFAYKYIDNWEPHLRLVFYSKRATTEEFRMNPELLVGEDTMQYLNLKHAWSQGRLGLKHFYDLYPTYVYDQRLGGIVQYANHRNKDWGWINWLEALADAYESLKADNKAVTDRPTYVDIPDFPENYKPDTLGLTLYPLKPPVY